jgi:uncharacterized protein
MLERGTAGSLILAAGITIAGLAVAVGVSNVKSSDRYVTVKGVSEREVRADVAIWPLHVVGADNDLSAAQAKLTRSIAGVRQFLARHGIDTTQVELTGFGVSDALAQQYGGDRTPTNRFVVRQTLLVRSSQLEQVRTASQRIGELASIGVVVSSGAGGEYGGQGGGPTFLFTKLNDLKPAMIAEATARAREAAEQFARDSRSDLGGIRKANQGVFEIVGREQAPGVMSEGQVAKLVRVVSTVEYFLRD